MNIIKCMLNIDKDNHSFIIKNLVIQFYDYYIVISYGMSAYRLWYDFQHHSPKDIKISIIINNCNTKHLKYNDQCSDVLDKMYKIFEEFYK